MWNDPEPRISKYFNREMHTFRDISPAPFVQSGMRQRSVRLLTFYYSLPVVRIRVDFIYLFESKQMPTAMYILQLVCTK